MKNKKTIFLIVFISFSMSLFLGMIDHETESLIHLLTSDTGNLVALLFYTLVFTILGLTAFHLIQFIKKATQ